MEQYLVPLNPILCKKTLNDLAIRMEGAWKFLQSGLIKNKLLK